MHNTTFTVHWLAVRNGVQTRGGYFVISAPGKREARKRAREGAMLERGERLRITNIVGSRPCGCC